MDYVIQLLEQEKKVIERSIKEKGLMQTDIRKDAKELLKITQIKKALKILKLKNRK